MRIVTWNVNSLRQRLEHVARLVGEIDPDVLCFQETKVEDADFPADDLRALGYTHLIFRGQKSYNGVAIASRLPLAATDHRVWCRRDDKRHVAATLPGGIELHNFYVPSGGPLPDPEKNDKFAHKLGFLEEMTQWAKTEARGKRLLLVGDLNVAPLETDVWNHKKLIRSVGHTPRESEAMATLLEAGAFVDAPRRFVPPDQPLYTWWGYRFPQSFAKNYGWRLDHAFATQSLIGAVARIEVAKQTRTWEKPSDHVPVVIDLTS